MAFQLAITGFLPAEPRFFRQIDELLGQLKAYLYEQQPDMEFQLLVSPSYTGGHWLEHMVSEDYRQCGYALQGDVDRLSGCTHVIRMDFGWTALCAA